MHRYSFMQGKYIIVLLLMIFFAFSASLGNCSMRYSTSCIHAVVR